MSLFDDMKDVRTAIAEFKEVQGVFASLEGVVIPDGSKQTAIQAAQALLAQAAEHHATIELALGELFDPKTAAAEFERLKAQATDHATALGAAVVQIKALVGAALGAVHEVIAAKAAAK